MSKTISLEMTFQTLKPLLKPFLEKHNFITIGLNFPRFTNLQNSLGSACLRLPNDLKPTFVNKSCLFCFLCLEKQDKITGCRLFGRGTALRPTPLTWSQRRTIDLRILKMIQSVSSPHGRHARFITNALAYLEATAFFVPFWTSVLGTGPELPMLRP